MKILIAEDERISAKVLKKIVEKQGHTAIICDDGLKAWEHVQKGDFRMVITDWTMPKMDGISLCAKVREAELSNYIYLILLSSKDQKADTVEGLRAGADDYITKPFNPEELRARIRSGERIIGLEDNHRQALGQLLQTEKMASIGQLAAGVAHEINNPTGFVSSNLKTLKDYQADMGQLITAYRNFLSHCAAEEVQIGKKIAGIKDLEAEIDIDYIMEDTSELINDCREGTERIKKIVLALKDFAHPGEDTMSGTDVNKGIDSTLNVVWNEIKYKADVKKNYGELPIVQCYPQQLNQVFMNLLVNAAQAIDEKGTITIDTKAMGDDIEIKIADTGAGIDEAHLLKIFDPFFTTKEVGMGTGLGLNMAYNIVNKHNGEIYVESAIGKGTTFTITLPVDQVM